MSRAANLFLIPCGSGPKPACWVYSHAFLGAIGLQKMLTLQIKEMES